MTSYGGFLMAESLPAFSHITLGTNDYARAAQFYDAALAPLGFSRVPKAPGKPPLYARDNQLPHL